MFEVEVEVLLTVGAAGGGIEGGVGEGRWEARWCEQFVKHVETFVK